MNWGDYYTPLQILHAYTEYIEIEIQVRKSTKSMYILRCTCDALNCARCVCVCVCVIGYVYER